jgi:DNA-binding NarL/FixJ family response regulator
MLHITPMERAALQLLADGRSIHEIAQRLRLDEADVEMRLKTFFVRMGLSNRAGATDCGRGSVMLDRKDLSPSIEQQLTC